uniref:VOC family protein n=1 Tax=Pararhizobium sp. IMCC3301 TaxID=3067904 RepID=UPI0027403B4E|nr:VOC family protein [Pararhizobium sp. IMCC3301]
MNMNAPEIATLEHVNVTVSDPFKTAQMLCDLFDWTIRWHGEAIHGGTTVHVGSEDTYLAVYSLGEMKQGRDDSYSTRGGLNHIGIVVADLGAVEEKVLAMGFKTHSHADYEPGRRFYFRDADLIEFEVVSYVA